MENPIEPNSFVLEISEYGNQVIVYNDTDKTRFIKTCKKTIDEFIENNVNKIDRVSNASFRIYTQ